MTDTVEKKNPVSKFVSDYWFPIVMVSCGIGLVSSLYSATIGHQREVTRISQQNPGCIYLESSRLGVGQHYMICNGQITLVRAQDSTDPQEVSDATVENAIAPEPTATPSAAATTPAK
jgi:hypothetical protein